MLLNRGLRQDKQCTYNLTMKRVRVTTVGVEEQYVLNVMNTYRESCLSHLACHSRHYCVVACGLSGYNLFFQIIS